MTKATNPKIGSVKHG